MKNFTIQRLRKQLVLVLLILFGYIQSQATIYTVVNVNDSGVGSLRDAISQANGHIGSDTVKFAIAGSGPHVIIPSSNLPYILDTINIDGFTQSTVGIYDIVLDGQNLVGRGLTFSDSSFSMMPISDSKINGLEIRNFTTGIASLPFVEGNDVTISYCRIYNCDLGINPNGFKNLNLIKNKISSCNKGIAINYFLVPADSPGFVFNKSSAKIFNNDIYNNTNGCYLSLSLDSSVVANNKIYNNADWGLDMGGCEKVKVESNKIYNNVTGGIRLNSGINNSISKNNLYSNGFGIQAILGESDLLIQQNLIGSDSLMISLGNNYGIYLDVRENNLSTNNQPVLNVKIVGNIIIYNLIGGIYCFEGENVFIVSNYIGTNNNNKTNFGNLGHGIEIVGSKNVKIGDGTPSGLNLICYNKKNGIQSSNGSCEVSYNLIAYNLGQPINNGNVGTLPSGNLSIKTPYILNKTLSGNQVTLKVNSDSTIKYFEVYKSNFRFDPIQYIPSTTSYKGNGYWDINLLNSNPLDTFVVSAIGSQNNTSEFGFNYNKDQVVINNQSRGYGSFKFVSEIANAFPDSSLISFDIPGAGPHEIKIEEDAGILLQYVTNVDATMNGKVVLNGTPSVESGSIWIAHLVNTPSGPDIGMDGFVSIKGLEFTNMSINGSAIAISGAQTVSIQKCNFKNGFRGFIVQRLSDSLIIDHCQFVNCNPLNTVPLINPQQFIFSNSIVDSCKVYGLFTGVGKNVLITNSQFINTSGSGILNPVANNESIQIINNLISGNVTGINLSATSNATVLIKGNIIGLTNDKATKFSNGIGVDIFTSYKKINIDSNWISGNNNIGIEVSNGTVIISRNYIGTNEKWQNLGNNHGIFNGSNYPNLYIGGTTLDSANYIGYNSIYGIFFTYTNGYIKHNYIGVSPTFQNMGNEGTGIQGPPYSPTPIIIQGNYVGYNGSNSFFVGGGINASLNAIFIENYIGGDSIHNFGNKQWGINNFRNCYAYKNYIANNELGGINVTSSSGKISQNTFSGNQPIAIYLNGGSGNNNKQAAAYTSSTVTSTLALSGSGVDGDTIELFYNSNSSNSEIALKYAGYAVVNSGSWALNVPKGVHFNPLQDNYFVNTATDNGGNTSALSTVYKVPLNICNSPSLNAFPTPQGICKDDSSLIDCGVKNAVSYEWYFNGSLIANTPSFWAKVPGDYRFVAKDTYGCIASDTLTITEQPLPLVADFLMTSEAGKNDNIIIVDVSFNHPDSLVWDFGPATWSKNGNDYIVTFADTGSYSVKLTSYLGLCSKSVTHYIHIDDTTHATPNGYVYPGEIKDITIGPNPNNGIFTLTADLGIQENITVEVFNAMGKLSGTFHSSNKSYSHTMDFDFSKFSSGNYLIKVTCKNDMRVLRMIKD